jgi:3-dehydroquinate synthase
MVLEDTLSSRVQTLRWSTTLSPSTRIDLGAGALAGIGHILAEQHAGRQVLILTQAPVHKTWAQAVSKALVESGYDCKLAELPDRDDCKELAQLEHVWTHLQLNGFARADTIVAVGGGSICDLAAFAASTYLRGLKLVLVPTTLLAQVDAALGGKTAINLPAGKNLAGTFYFPDAVVIDPLTLSSLPPDEIRCGLAEVIKYGLIEQTISSQCRYQSQHALLPLLEKIDWNGFTCQHDDTLKIIDGCVRMKLAVVATDPHESRLRRALNLGHTLAHALEKASAHSLSHGQAVAVGLAFAATLSARLKHLKQDSLERITNLLQRVGLPISIPDGLDREAVRRSMSFDKKRSGAAIKFVLPVEPVGCVDLEYKLELQDLPEIL